MNGSESSFVSVVQFLENLGLRQYSAVFKKEAVDFEMLRELDDGDLRTLGLPLGHRKKILKAISDGLTPTEDGETDPEFRRVSVLVCDLVNSTHLSQSISTEDLRDLLASFQKANALAIEGHGGHVAKYLGDGVMAYFGYPKAHEDDSVRAVEAALDVMEAVNRIKTPDGSNLEARIGIHTGRVVAGEMGAGQTREKLSVVGEAPIVASRLEQLAGSNQILISDAVQRLAEGYVSSVSVGEHKLKGIETPMHLFRVVGRTEARNRIEANRIRGLAKIVGRQEEIALLQSRWERVRQGDGQGFLLIGEPGIGKSRLATNLHDRLQTGNFPSIVVQCSAQHTNSALHPFIKALESAAGVVALDDGQLRREKVADHLASTLGAEARELYSSYQDMSEQSAPNAGAAQVRRAVMSMLTNWIGRLAADGAGCILFEDAHWADPSSLELLNLLVARTHDVPMFIVVTARPGFNADWNTQHNVTSLSLNRLQRSVCREIVGAQLDGGRWGDDRVEEIVNRAEGVPLFLEEFARVAREIDQSSQVTAIPDTLDESLSARLDVLGSAKKLAQVGSVLGRQFPHYLLAEILGSEYAGIKEQLAELIDADVLARQGDVNQSEYIFTHALVQDAAYGSMLKRDRVQLHDRVADVLIRLKAERNFPDEMIAHHLAGAERFDEAAHYWFLAGRTEQLRSADREAIEHFRAGIEALNALPPSREKHEREFEIVMALAPLVLVVCGWSSAETTEIYARARELSQGIKDRKPLLPIYYGEYLIHVSRAEYATALKLARELLDLAEELKDEGGQLQGHRVVAWCSLYLGRLNEAETHAAQLLDIYRSDRHHGIALEYGYDPRVAGLSILAIVHALKGEKQSSAEFGQQAVDHARAMKHASSLAYALMFACAMAAAMRSDSAEANRFGHELKILAKDQDSALWNAYSDVILGWSGDGNAEVISSAINQLSQTARNPWRPFFQALCADRYLRSGQREEARSLLEEALAAVDRTEERNWEAEICRLMGRLASDDTNIEEGAPQKWFRRSIKSASQSGAFELETRTREDLAAVVNS